MKHAMLHLSILPVTAFEEKVQIECTYNGSSQTCLSSHYVMAVEGCYLKTRVSAQRGGE
jgi:hypothetical protein